MAEVKWVKLNVDMFDNRKIKHLRRLPEGNNIVLIWIMLLTMAGRCNSGGMIFLTENIPYTTKMLADELDFEENTVQLALQVLEQLGMISMQNSFFFIAGWQEHQNIEGMEKIREQNRIRKQRQRENERKMLIGAENICVYCGGAGTTVDHVIAKANGGQDAPENTVCCCSSCNLQKNNHDVLKFLNDRLASGETVDIQRIEDNAVLQKHVRYDRASMKFVTGHVTGRHAIDIDKDKDIDKEKVSKKERPQAGYDTILATISDDLLRETYLEYIKMRKMIKSPMTDRALQMLINKVEQLEPGNPDRQKMLLDNAILNNWKSVYPLKEQPAQQKQTQTDDFLNQLKAMYTPGG